MDSMDPDSQLEFSINLIDLDVETVTPDAAEEEEAPLHLPDDPWDICMHELDSSSVILMPSSPIDKTEPPSVFPIHQLPIDVLISIFLAAVDTKHHDGTLTMSRTHPAVVASHVCREWREIALSTAALWSHIHLILPPYPFCLFEIMCSRAESFTGMNQKQAEDYWKKGLEGAQKMTEIWLTRSGSCPLSVNVGEVEESHLVGEEGWPEDKMADGLVHLNKIIDLLCDASPRWRDFTFSCTVTPHTRRLLFTPTQCCRLLRSAQVEPRICSWGGWEGKFMSSATLLMAESLRSLEIPGLLQDIASIPVNWSNLTNLTFGGYWGVDMSSGIFSISAPFGGHQALELLSKCPNLRRVYLRVVDGQTDWSLEAVLLQFLEEIILEPATSPFSLPVGFAPSLNLPSLCKYMMTDGYGENIPSVHNGLVECIHEFGATLTDVTFCYIPLNQSALYDCLQQLPKIVRLNLLGLRYKVDRTRDSEHASLSRELMAKMTPEFNESGGYIVDSCFCPRIQEFSCRPNQGTLDEAAFVDFISGRRRVATSNNFRSLGLDRLQKVSVDCRGFAFVEPYQFKTDVAQELKLRGVDMTDFSFSLID